MVDYRLALGVVGLLALGLALFRLLYPTPLRATSRTVLDVVIFVLLVVAVVLLLKLLGVVHF
jgi:hypothetical protein